MQVNIRGRMRRIVQLPPYPYGMKNYQQLSMDAREGKRQHLKKSKMDYSSTVRELKEFMRESLKMVDDLETFCTRNLGAYGPCEGCFIHKVLELSIRKILKELNNKPQNPTFGYKMRLVFESLNPTCGFWTFTQTLDGWILYGAGFKQEDWPLTYDHAPVRIQFKGPFLVKSLREICLERTAKILRKTKVKEV